MRESITCHLINLSGDRLGFMLVDQREREREREKRPSGLLEELDMAEAARRQ
jgi:hypothetical protein